MPSISNQTNSVVRFLAVTISLGVLVFTAWAQSSDDYDKRMAEARISSAEKNIQDVESGIKQRSEFISNQQKELDRSNAKISQLRVEWTKDQMRATPALNDEIARNKEIQAEISSAESAKERLEGKKEEYEREKASAEIALHNIENREAWKSPNPSNSDKRVVQRRLINQYYDPQKKANVKVFRVVYDDGTSEDVEE